MRFYAACLASYNNGVLHGAWIDATDDPDEMQEDINAMLRDSKFPNVMVTCPLCEGSGSKTHHNSDTGDTRQAPCYKCHGEGQVPSAEEWAIHDYDDMPNFGEYPGLNKIASWVELVDGNDTIDPDDLAAIVDYFSGDLVEADEALSDRFHGIHNSFRDYADEFAEECILVGDINETVKNYFDYAAFARDLQVDYDVVDVTGGRVAIFSR